MTAVAAWLRIAAFGLPVVPEVYINAQMSSGRTATIGASEEPLLDQRLVRDQPCGVLPPPKWTKR